MAQELGIEFNSIQIPPEGMERSPWAYASNPGFIDANKIKNLEVDTITVSPTGYIRSGKTSFTDSTNAGWYQSAAGIYFGAASDASKFKYDISLGTIDFIGAHSSGTVGGVNISTIVNSNTTAADIVPTSLAVSSTGVTSSPDGSQSANVVLTWTTIATSTFNNYVIRYKKSSYTYYTYVNTSVNTITLDGLTPNTSYDFAIASVNKYGTVSSFSSTLTSTTAATTVAPATVTAGSATAGIQYVIVEWTQNTEADLASYNIYRNTTNNSGTATLIANTRTNYFLDGGRTGGQIYYYWVKAVNTSGLVSVAFSTAVSATPRNVVSSDNNIANIGWTQTCIFSTTDADTVAWGSGVFTASNGVSYNISAGNTGNMAARTYIYLDIAVSTTVYQTTTTATTAVGDGKVLIATAKNNVTVGATDCSFQVFGGVGGITIDGGDIISESITTNEIAANTIEAGNVKAGTLTATEIDTSTITSLSNLSLTASQILIDGAVYLSNWRKTGDVTKIDGGSISANTVTTTQLNFTPIQGTNVIASINASAEGIKIDADNLRIGTSTNYWDISTSTKTALTATSTDADVIINYGKTDFGDNTTAGFILGYDYSATTSKFEMGSSASKLFKYDGTDISLIGGSISGGTITIGTGDNVFIAGSNGIQLGDATFADAPFQVDMAGNARVKSLARDDFHWFTAFESLDGYGVSAQGNGSVTVSNLGVSIETGDTYENISSLQKVLFGGFTWDKNRNFKVCCNFTNTTSQTGYLITGFPGSDEHIGFYFSGGDSDLYGTTGDGTNGSYVNLGALSSGTQILEVKYIAGVSAKFYVNGTYVNQLTTNLPSGDNFSEVLLTGSLRTDTSGVRSMSLSWLDFWQAN